LRARRCYERCGFQLTGQRGVVAKSGEAEIQMAWRVAGADAGRSGES
jgi:hypothetical protein